MRIKFVPALFGNAATAAEETFQVLSDSAKLQWADTGLPLPNTHLTVLTAAEFGRQPA